MFIRLTIGGVIIASIYTMLLGALPLYATEAGLSATLLGIIVACYPVGAAIFRVGFAGLIDRYPYQQSLVAATVMGLAAYGLYLLLAPGAAYIVPRILHGMASAAFYTAAYAWIATNTPIDQRGARMGIFGAGTGLAVVVMPPLGLALLDLGGADLLFLFGLGACLLILPLAWSVSGRPSREGADAPPLGPTSWVLMLALLITIAPLGITEAFLPLIAAAKQVASLSLVYVVFGVALAAGRILGGTLCDRYGRRIVSLVALAALVISQLLIFLAEGTLAMSVTAFLSGAGIGAALTALFTWLADLTPAAHQGRVLGLGSLFIDVGTAAGAAVAGPFADAGVQSVIGLSIAVSAGAVGLAIIAGQMIAQRPREEAASD